MQKWDCWATFGAREPGYRPRLCPSFPWWQNSLDVSGIHLKHESFELDFISLSASWLCSFMILCLSCHTGPLYNQAPWAYIRFPYRMYYVLCILASSSQYFAWIPSCKAGLIAPLLYAHSPPGSRYLSLSSVGCKLLEGRDWDLFISFFSHACCWNSSHICGNLCLINYLNPNLI